MGKPQTDRWIGKPEGRGGGGETTHWKNLILDPDEESKPQGKELDEAQREFEPASFSFMADGVGYGTDL